MIESGASSSSLQSMPSSSASSSSSNIAMNPLLPMLAAELQLQQQHQHQSQDSSSNPPPPPPTSSGQQQQQLQPLDATTTGSSASVGLGSGGGGVGAGSPIGSSSSLAETTSGEPEAKRKKMDPAASVMSGGNKKLESRLGGILCCAVCRDLPKGAMYQVSHWNVCFFVCFRDNLINKTTNVVTFR